jgi:hypothetical protein
MQQPQDQNKKCNEKKITLVIKPDIKSKETTRQILWQDFRQGACQIFIHQR